MTANEKLRGSSIVDFIPQILTGDPVPCPLQCPDCYYNLACAEKSEWVQSAGRLSSGIGESEFIPTENGTAISATIDTLKPNTIVRVNSGLDSNQWKDIVLERTRDLRHRFYNTSLPNFDFPGPVVFTANPGWLDKDSMKFQGVPSDRKDIANIMYVRFRVGNVDKDWSSLISSQAGAWIQRGIPVVLTFMRYCEKPALPDDGFEHAKHFDHKWWQPTLSAKRDFYATVSEGRHGIYVCGGLDGDERCAVCRLCESLYWLWYSRHQIDNWKATP